MAVIANAFPAAAAPAERKSYIVVLKDSVARPGAVSREHAKSNGARVSHVYRFALKGYAATMPARAARDLASDKRVAFVQEDQAVHALDHGSNAPTGVRRVFAPNNPNLAIDGHDDKRVDADVAIIDTGILSSHSDLNVVGGRNCSTGKSWEDGNGHGTHVAGTAAGIDNGNGAVGLASGARLWAARVLDNSGSGSWSSVICGIDWVTGLKDADGSPTIEAANMSLGGSGSEPSNPGGDMESCNPGTGSSLYNAICKSVRAGVSYAVAAGNESANASTSVPAAYRSVMTVSALADFDGLPGALHTGSKCRSDEDDTFANFSNYGGAVDLIAPGVCIRSAWKDGGYRTISGTSMASPHTAGAAALLKSSNPGWAPSTVKQTLQSTGNLDWNNSDDRDSTKERLLDVGSTTFNPAKVDGTETGSDPSNADPIASFEASCTELACQFTDTSTDSDGSVVEWNWAFGDGNSSNEQSPAHSYASSGTYSVLLTVTDNGGGTASTSRSVTVTSSSDPPAATLSVGVEKVGNTYKKGPWHYADLRVTVTDADGAVSGASVVLDVYSGSTCSGSATSGSGTTGSNGTVTFSFRNRTPGTYCASATATKSGYESGSGSTTFSL